MATKKQWADLAERAAWTFVQAGIPELVVDLSVKDLPNWAWVIPFAGAFLSVIKGKLAQKFSETGSAATLPVELDPAAGRHEA